MEITTEQFNDLQTDVASIKKILGKEYKEEIAAIKKILKKEYKPEILTSSEVMNLLRISRNTYNRMKDEGIIKVYTMRGKLLSKRIEILQALEEGKIN